MGQKQVNVTYSLFEIRLLALTQHNINQVFLPVEHFNEWFQLHKRAVPLKKYVAEFTSRVALAAKQYRWRSEIIIKDAFSGYFCARKMYHFWLAGYEDVPDFLKH